MIGEVIKGWRQRHYVGQREVAKLIGISTSTLCRIEQGKQVDQAGMMKLMNWLFATSPTDNEETGK